VEEDSISRLTSIEIDLKNWGGGGLDVEMFENLPRDWNIRPIFTQKWASVDMNWGFSPPTPGNSNPASDQRHLFL